MGIGSVTSMNNMSGMQMMTTGSADSKSKSIENEITTAKQQMQKLSSEEELSVSEKAVERKKFQKEISNLNTELKQHQEELRKSQKREIMMAELQEDTKPAKEEKSEDKIQKAEASPNKADEKNPLTEKQQTGQQETVIANNNDGMVILKEEMNTDATRSADAETKQAVETKEEAAADKKEAIADKEARNTERDAATDAGLSRKETFAIASADSSVQQANRQGTVIARIRDGIAILKGEMEQDELSGVNTEKKQDALEEMEKKEQRAVTFQFSILGEANNTMKAAVETNAVGTTNGTQVNAENNAYINALRLSQGEDPALQQTFQVTFR